MRKTLALICTALIFSCNAEKDVTPGNSTTFVKLFGGSNSDEAAVAFETTDGGFIVLGTTVEENDDGSETNKIRLIKTDEYGNTNWDKQFPDGNDNDLNYKSNSLKITEEGDYLIIGDIIYPSGKTGILLLQINSHGMEVKNNSYFFTEVQDTINAKGIDLAWNGSEWKITGEIDSNTKNLFVGTVNPDDLSVIPVCSFRYSSSSTNPSVIKSVCVEENGDIVFSTVVNNNSRVIRVPNCQNTEISGPLIQSGTRTYKASQIVKSVTGYAIIGTTNQNNNTDFFLARVNDLGDNATVTIYTNIEGITLSEAEEAFTISTTNDGGFIFGGSTLSSTKGETDMIIVKTNLLGEVEWSERFGDQNEERVKFVTQTSDGGFLILGDIEFGGIDNLILIKTDKNGKVN